ncbi:hypothetical protein FFLO_02956 [Filobasidium floriforme]|uniref:NADH dehydrogenase [ubiquinone] iron-sulfur protein 4, mitochondrial n=1 Tax=Filobasidium floriforme TaxID=5210 RepID=A0A8K0JLL4_9TREE|nr:hypothetical protein FFLO_02956 [Filobasidium floriforme]
MFAVRRSLLLSARPSPISTLTATSIRLNSNLTSTPTRQVTDPKENVTQSIVSHDQATIDAHQNSGLTTSHPSPEIISADVLSDAPYALHARQVRIYQPTKSTMQSAKQGTSHWQIDWDTLQGAGRWENELMGWGSTADYMQGTSMRFRTREAAIHFAEKQGWSYQVDKVQEARIPPKSYAENYVHIPGKLRRYQTK